MAFIDILLGLILYFGYTSLRPILPRNVVPLASTSFDKAVALLERAEAANIPHVSEYRENLAILHPQLLLLRRESHLSPGFFQQLFRCGLTWRLKVLKSKIDDIERMITMGLDKHWLASHTNASAEGATTTGLSPSTANTDIPMTNVTDPKDRPEKPIWL